MGLKWLWIGFIAACCLSCSKEPGFQLQVDLRNANAGDVLLYRLTAGESPVRVDSFRTTHLDEQFILSDPGATGESLYQLTLTASRKSLYFIADARKVLARINAVNPGEYTTEGSRGSTALQQLQRLQQHLMDSLVILNNKINNQIGDPEPLRRANWAIRDQINQQYAGFADTTTVPLAALFAIQQVDFGDDRERQKAFVRGLEKRFPDHAPVQAYVRDMQAYFSLLEVEYRVGDTLPPAVFYDWFGRQLRPSAWNRTWYLLEFWASYCPPCMSSLNSKKALYDKYHPKGFEIMAFSLDPDRDMLQAALNANRFPWPVIADLKGWTGQAAYTYKIDSIPFNFLVAPGGKVAAVNVSTDSLERVLQRWTGENGGR